MTPFRVGWYIHHHGQGHLTRLMAIAPHVAGDIVCFSSLPEPVDLPDNCTWVLLERDDSLDAKSGEPLHDRDPAAGGLLHWAPLLHGGHRRRLTAIATVLDASPVTAFVVDVSVEVTLFARLLGIPPILITQPGDRDDDPHHLAFRAASRIIAPWPGDLFQPNHLKALSNVVYVGGITRFDSRSPSSARGTGVLLLGGAGGSAVSEASIAAAIDATPGYDWTVAGTTGRNGSAWLSDPWDALCNAEVVVAWAGQNSIADIAAAGARAVVFPQDRPFEEQAQSAKALKKSGLAIVESVWPAAAAWPALLQRARSLQPEWSRWRTSGAAKRAALEITSLAGGGPQ